MTLSEVIKILEGATVTLPVLEIASLTLIVSLCLVFRYNRTGLITAYLFAYRWGWPFFHGQSQQALMAYMWFGGAVVLLTVISMLRDSNTGDS